jgi:hypothetical protein
VQRCGPAVKTGTVTALVVGGCRGQLAGLQYPAVVKQGSATGLGDNAKDGALEAVRREWLKVSDSEERQLIASKVRERAFATVPYISIGEYLPKTASCKNLKGVIDAPALSCGTSKRFSEGLAPPGRRARGAGNTRLARAGRRRTRVAIADGQYLSDSPRRIVDRHEASIAFL